MERIALTIIEACQAAGVGRTSIYAAIARGELAARKRGRRTLVLMDDLRNWVNQLPAVASRALKEVQLKSEQAMSEGGGSNGSAQTLRANIGGRSSFKCDRKHDNSSGSNRKTAYELKRLGQRWPDEYRDGARCAFLRRFDGDRQEGGYPRGFHHWPLERRNVWFAGFNRGLCDRSALLRSEAAQ